MTVTDLRRLAWTTGTPVRLLLVGAIRIYRVTLGGLLGGQCKFYPTCSMYAEDAIRVHGAVRGAAMAVWRVARCGPFTSGGVDHVPPRDRHAMSDDVTHGAAA